MRPCTDPIRSAAASDVNSAISRGRDVETAGCACRAGGNATPSNGRPIRRVRSRFSLSPEREDVSWLRRRTGNQVTVRAARARQHWHFQRLNKALQPIPVHPAIAMARLLTPTAWTDRLLCVAAPTVLGCLLRGETVCTADGYG